MSGTPGFQPSSACSLLTLAKSPKLSFQNFPFL